MTGPDGGGTGGSHGGQGGADGYQNSPSQSYGSLIAPDDFGSGGGNDSSSHAGRGLWIIIHLFVRSICLGGLVDWA